MPGHIYHHTTAASNPKVEIPRVATLAKNIFPNDGATSFLDKIDMIKFVSESFIPLHKISELEQSVSDIVSSTSQITSTCKINNINREEMIVSRKKFKQWTDSIEKFKKSFNSAKEEIYTVEDKIAWNKMVYQSLSVLIEKHGYTMGLNKSKRFFITIC